MKIKKPEWLVVSSLALYFFGVSTGAEWQWYFRIAFFLGFILSVHLSNK